MTFRIHWIIPLFCALFASPLHAESTGRGLSSCNFSGSGLSNIVTVSGGRVVRVGSSPTIKLKLRKRAQQIECADTNGDGIDEIVSFDAAGTRTITIVRAAKRASLSTYCKKVRSLTRGEIWKSIASKHINDQRKFSTSFITLRSTGAPRNNCLSVYDKKGNLVHTLGRYFPNGAEYSSRYYGGYGCGDRKSAATAAALAKKNTGSSAGYMTSGTGNCVLIPNINACFNSSGC